MNGDGVVVSYCLLGALYDSVPDAPSRRDIYPHNSLAYDILSSEVDKVCRYGITGFNDLTCTSLADVLRVLDLAINVARSRERKEEGII